MTGFLATAGTSSAVTWQDVIITALSLAFILGVIWLLRD